MSRLPVLRNSSPPPMDSITTRSLKRKATDDPEEQPRKVAATGTTRPIRTLPQPRIQPTTSAVPKPKPLTKPKPPNLTTTTRLTRGTSAPPTKPSSRTNATTRSATSTLRGGGGKTAEDRAARIASTKLAAEMDAEKTRVSELQAKQLALARELADARAQELSQRRELVNFSDELEDLKKQHNGEIDQLQSTIQQRDKEIQELNQDLSLCRTDLDQERQTITSLNSTISNQQTIHTTLTSQIDSLQSQNSSLRNQNDEFQRMIAEYRFRLESNNQKLKILQQEVLESEFVRRKLHNMVLELKGNIRVFCRVRPILQSDFTHTSSHISHISHTSSSTQTITPEQFTLLKTQSQAQITYPDQENHKEIVIQSTSESATGQERKEVYSFCFDRVFEPGCSQADVFEEISLLAQSCMDGYNVCIFAYGQTGSGKSFTMEGGATEESAGMIPRAVEQLFKVAQQMKSKGWEYKIEGQFIEIYNETINDLLSPSSSSNTTKKHEIKHDPKTKQTSITNISTIPLTSPSQVDSLLSIANKRRSVAATLMNERSSRSHSVFRLKIVGENVGFKSFGCDLGGGGDLRSDESNGEGRGDGEGEGEGEVLSGGTGEKCYGCLNLVDLAGSERLNVSFGNGYNANSNSNANSNAYSNTNTQGGLPPKERLNETKSINKSLSALGDVIAALGEKGHGSGSNSGSGSGSNTTENGNGSGSGSGGRHIPYRNSKLTYLLQNSLSRNSKTLMFLNLSPLAVHLNESITSLRFATKVNNTQLGTKKSTSASR